MLSAADKRREMDELKAAANARALEILRRLGITAAPRGHNGTIAVCDPMQREENPSLVIWLGRPGGLSWKRYGSDAQGDIVRLVSYLKGWWPPGNDRDAIVWLKDMLGFRAMSPAQRARMIYAPLRPVEKTEIDRARELERMQRWARGLFFGALSPLNTPVESYLREARGIDLRTFPRGPRGANRTPHCVRFLPRHAHRESGLELPCMVACCVEPSSGEVKAVHRTWLAADGRRKAAVRPARKVFPDFRGLIIPIWKGGSYLSIREAIGCGLLEQLGMTEGLEDGLAWAAASPQTRIWSGISLDNIGNVILPACIDAVLLARQNDTNLAAQTAWSRARERLARQNHCVVEPMLAFHGKDLSDTFNQPLER
jgi:Toprim domain-containing protein